VLVSCRRSLGPTTYHDPAILSSLPTIRRLLMLFVHPITRDVCFPVGACAVCLSDLLTSNNRADSSLASNKQGLHAVVQIHANSQQAQLRLQDVHRFWLFLFGTFAIATKLHSEASPHHCCWSLQVLHRMRIFITFRT